MNQEVDNNRLYELLGVTKEATAEEIKAAFQKLEEEHKDSDEPDGVTNGQYRFKRSDRHTKYYQTHKRKRCMINLVKEVLLRTISCR